MTLTRLTKLCRKTIAKGSQANPYTRLAESRVLHKSMAIVIGPTPPGTGVTADATFNASS